MKQGESMKHETNKRWNVEFADGKRESPGMKVSWKGASVTVDAPTREDAIRDAKSMMPIDIGEPATCEMIFTEPAPQPAREAETPRIDACFYRAQERIGDRKDLLRLAQVEELTKVGADLERENAELRAALESCVKHFRKCKVSGVNFSDTAKVMDMADEALAGKGVGV